MWHRHSCVCGAASSTGLSLYKCGCFPKEHRQECLCYDRLSGRRYRRVDRG